MLVFFIFLAFIFLVFIIYGKMMLENICGHIYKLMYKHNILACFHMCIHACTKMYIHNIYIYIYICELRTYKIEFTHTHTCGENFNI